MKDHDTNLLDNDEDGAKHFDSCSFVGPIKEVISKYTHCESCGSHLHFTYFTDFSRNITQESRRCPECNDASRKILHRLQ